MANQRVNVDYPAPVIPKRHMPWFTQLLLAFAGLVLVGVVYSFWRMSTAPAAVLEVPAQDAPAASPNAPAASPNAPANNAPANNP
jgi:hypothetical protein